jgi:acyl carrier protein
VLIAARLDLAALRALGDRLPALYRGLLPVRPSRASGAAAGPAVLAGLLAGLSAGQQHQRVLEVVRAEVADVLGHPRPAAIDPERGLLDLGFDSLTAVELRNRLMAVTGLKLSATLAFDYPTMAALASHLVARLVPDGVELALAQAESLRELLATLDPVALQAVAGRLRETLPGWSPEGEHGGATDDLGQATDEELFNALDNELGNAQGAP